jgi:sterol desaturase/sphingolipid hydroxylase (fatty acid hydroxylase superfamily)
MNWNDWILGNELPIRLSFFFGIFAVMAVWEILSPRRPLTVAKGLRWANNLGLVFLNSFVLRLLFPAAAVGVAALAQQRGWGLLNFNEIPFLLSVIIAVIVMDFVIYLQHVMVHAVPLLWRLHRVHHADLDYDVTTGARFHTVIFEVLLNGTAMFNHGNVRLPLPLDRVLRWFVVTPDMHRVHHSVEDDEANSNFGFSLPWWDRLFGTYRDQPRGGHEGMTIGIHQYRDPKQVERLPGMLALPFIGKISGYAINRREWSSGDEK